MGLNHWHRKMALGLTFGFCSIGLGGGGLNSENAQGAGITAKSITDLVQAPSKTDKELLAEIQDGALRYFWDFGHPVSGMARERSNVTPHCDHDRVTTGGTGFGIMAMVAAVERGRLKREEVAERLLQITEFLEKAETYHGVFPHHMDGRTGKTIPFSRKDDGGDLVETSFLMAGLLCAREYFDGSSPEEAALRARINALWQAVEWDWHTRGEDVLYWHWSPRHGWEMNLPIQGWNEGLLAYVMAASSPAHAIDPAVYHKGWTGGRDFINGREYYGIKLPLGPDHGGPLFVSQYPFFALDPEGLKDRYADYEVQARNHPLINREHCIRNPHGHAGYGPDCWGLTSSDGLDGYRAFSPDYDKGVITPAAALGSLPFTPDESLQALRGFAQVKGLMGPYGLKDAFHPGTGWVADSYLAIDVGAIAVAAANYETGLLHRLFMNCPEVQAGLRKLGFDSPYLAPRPPVMAPKP